jgi:hypothetical protein
VQLYVPLLLQGLESAATMPLTILRLLCCLCYLQVADWQWRQQARELCRGNHPTMRHTHLCHTHLLSCAVLSLCWLCAVQVADWQWGQQARELCRSYHPTMRHAHLCHTHRQQLL